VSGSYGFFYGQGIRLANALSLTGQVTEVVPWSDPNHDHIVEANEIPNGGVVSADFDAATGLTYPSGNTIDPNLKNSRTREATVSLDHEITRNLSVSASYVHRTYDRFIWTPGIDDTSANYIAKTWTDPVSGLTSTYYELKPGAGLSGFTETTNQPGRYLTYQGLDLMVRKRFGDRWMMNAALTLQSSIDHWPAGSYTDPTGIDKLNGQPGDPYLPRYLAKLNGRVLLPWGLGASATANIQDGFIRDIVFNGPPTRNGLPFTTLMAAPQGATRYPALTMVDVQVDKTVKLSARMRLTLNAVVFNAFNAGTVLSAVNNLSLTTYGNVLSLVGPRVARFGATITF
jgi:hypothetical protein